jgi:hypothetical protein
VNCGDHGWICENQCFDWLRAEDDVVLRHTDGATIDVCGQSFMVTEIVGPKAACVSDSPYPVSVWKAVLIYKFGFKVLKPKFGRSKQQVAVSRVNPESRLFPNVGVPHLPINRGISDELIPCWLTVLQSVGGKEHHTITGLNHSPHVRSTNAPCNTATEP